MPDVLMHGYSTRGEKERGWTGGLDDHRQGRRLKHLSPWAKTSPLQSKQHQTQIVFLLNCGRSISLYFFTQVSIIFILIFRFGPGRGAAA